MKTTINSRKFDGSVSRSWTAEFIGRSGDRLDLVGVFSEEVTHPHLGTIPLGTVSYEYYWLDRWYNVFRFLNADGSLRNFYCNLNMPPTFEDGVLDYIDLDIDVLVWPDGRVDVLDREDFAENARRFNYSPDLKMNVERSLAELLAMVRAKDFPFCD